MNIAQPWLKACTKQKERCVEAIHHQLSTTMRMLVVFWWSKWWLVLFDHRFTTFGDLAYPTSSLEKILNW
jgi:hypothetical protein